MPFDKGYYQTKSSTEMLYKTKMKKKSKEKKKEYKDSMIHEMKEMKSMMKKK